MDIPAATIIAGAETGYDCQHQFAREPGFPYYTLGCLVEGSVRSQYMDGPWLERHAVSMSLTPPGMPYQLQSDGPHHELYFIFAPRTSWRQWLQWGIGVQGPSQQPYVVLDNSEARERVLRCLRDALAYSRLPGQHGARLAELAFEQALILTASQVATGQADVRLTRVQQALQERLAHPWQDQEMAEMAGLSLSRFAHLFRQTFSMPPRRYLEHLRIEEAKALLLTSDRPIKDIAAATGYPDPLHFSRRFRARMGRSPQDFRTSQACSR